jgi:hypothetical protein
MNQSLLTNQRHNMQGLLASERSLLESARVQAQSLANRANLDVFIYRGVRDDGLPVVWVRTAEEGDPRNARHFAVAEVVEPNQGPWPST